MYFSYASYFLLIFFSDNKSHFHMCFQQFKEFSLSFIAFFNKSIVWILIFYLYLCFTLGMTQNVYIESYHSTLSSR